MCVELHMPMLQLYQNNLSETDVHANQKCVVSTLCVCDGRSVDDVLHEN